MSDMSHQRYLLENAELLGDIIGLGWTITQNPDFSLVTDDSGELRIDSSDPLKEIGQLQILIPRHIREREKAKDEERDQKRLESAVGSLQILANGMTEHFGLPVELDSDAQQLTYNSREIVVDRLGRKLNLTYFGIVELDLVGVRADCLQMETIDNLFGASGLTITRLGGTIDASQIMFDEPVPPPATNELEALRDTLRDFGGGITR